MDNMLEGIKNTATATSKEPYVPEYSPVWETDNAELTAKKIFNKFRVGEMVVLVGCEAFECPKGLAPPNIPEWMELRCCMRRGCLVVHFPKGWLVWQYLQAWERAKQPKQFKFELEVKGEYIEYKIWRSK